MVHDRAQSAREIPQILFQVGSPENIPDTFIPSRQALRRNHRTWEVLYHSFRDTKELITYHYPNLSNHWQVSSALGRRRMAILLWLHYHGGVYCDTSLVFRGRVPERFLEEPTSARLLSPVNGSTLHLISGRAGENVWLDLATETTEEPLWFLYRVHDVQADDQLALENMERAGYLHLHGEINELNRFTNSSFTLWKWDWFLTALLVLTIILLVCLAIVVELDRRRYRRLTESVR